MLTKLGFFVVMFFLAMDSFAQSKTTYLDVNKLITEDTIGKEIVHIITYQFQNKSNKELWLWFEKDDVSKLSDSLVIRKHFLTTKGEVNLYQIGVDGSVNSFIPDLFNSFLKAIPPNEKFSVIIIRKQNTSKIPIEEATNYLDNHIISFKINYILNYFPFLKFMEQIVFVQDNSFLVEM